MNRFFPLGLFASILIVWLSSALFMDSIPTCTWDPAIQDYAPISGAKYVFRSEGRGETVFGEHGIVGGAGYDDPTTGVVAIWGDSFVEAFQVPDGHKMSTRFNEIWNSLNARPLRAVSIGRSGFSIANYYFSIPLYRKIIPNIVYNVVVISSLRDLLPDQSDFIGCSFISSPDYAFIKAPPPGKSLKRLFLIAKQFMNRTGMQYLYYAYVDIMIGAPGKKPLIKNLRFMPGVRSGSGSGEGASRDSVIDRAGFKFIVDKMREVSDVPIIFVYLPNVPSLHDGKIVTRDVNSEKMKTFADVCSENGIIFVSMERRFNELFRSARKFPRGFPNTVPGVGHLNEDGHRLVAMAIADAIKEDLYGIHSN